MSFRALFLLGLFLFPTEGVLAQVSEQRSSPLTRCVSRQLSATPVPGVLISDGEHIYAGTADGTLSAFDAKDVAPVWRVELGGEFASGLVLTEGGVVVVTNAVATERAADGSTLRLLSRDSGVTSWVVKLPFSERYFLARVNGSIAAVNNEGQITSVDRSTGQIQWQSAPLGKLSARPSFTAASILIPTSDKSLIVISAKAGSLISRQSTEFIPTAAAFFKNEAIVAGDERGNVTLFASQNAKSVWRFKSGAGVTFVSATDNGILVTSLDNFVYLISDYNGDVVWKRRLTGRVVEGGLAVEGHFVVLINGENAAYVIDLQKGKVTDAIPASDVDMISRVPALVRNRTFVLSTLYSLDTYAFGGCSAN